MVILAFRTREDLLLIDCFQNTTRICSQCLRQNRRFPID